MTPIPMRTQTGASFTLTPTLPASWAARMDLVTVTDDLFSPSTPNPVRTRLGMAALGIGCGGQRNPVDPRMPYAIPAYDGSGDLRAYGGQVMEVLIGRWRVLPSPEMVGVIIDYINAVAETLPTEQAVQRARDFTEAPEEPSPPASA